MAINATDNDVVLKAAAYRLASRLLAEPFGVLGTARFVARRALERGRVHDTEAAGAAVDDLLDTAEVLEPTEKEVAIAAELEAVAQRHALALDSGESLLAAITVERDLRALDTGDKRAVAAIAALDHDCCRALYGRVRSLEQLFLGALDPEQFAATLGAVCAEPDVDKTITICFACKSGGAGSVDDVRSALASYIGDLRRAAPDVLVADDDSFEREGS